eukprot:3917979-Prymnesium_polylepis.1
MWGWVHSALEAYTRSCVASVARIAAALHVHSSWHASSQELAMSCAVELAMSCAVARRLARSASFDAGKLLGRGQ